MPVKHLISPGIGFSPASVKYIVTRGLSIGAVAIITPKTTFTAHLRSGDNQTAQLQSGDNQAARMRSADNQTAKVVT